MGAEERDIRIIGVDKAAIRESANQKGCWILPFKLSGKPSASWASSFYEVHRKNAAEVQWKADVNDDLILVNISGTDDQQKVLDAIKIDVVGANAICEENYQKKVKIQEELAALKKKHNDTLTKLQEGSDNLQF